MQAVGAGSGTGHTHKTTVPIKNREWRTYKNHVSLELVD
jgi:hypothetical protein